MTKTTSNEPTGGADAYTGFNLDMTSGSGVSAHLDRRVSQILGDVYRSEVWTTITSLDTPPSTVRDIMSEVHLGVLSFQKDVLEASLASIGQLPHDLPVDMVKQLVNHQIDAFDHREIVLSDYGDLGRDEHAATSQMRSPTSFAIAAVWRMIVHERDPFLYLGAHYLIDAVSFAVSKRVVGHLEDRSDLSFAADYLNHHADEDERHDEHMREIIALVVDRLPETAASITCGFEYLAEVYPLRHWSAAMQYAATRPSGT